MADMIRLRQICLVAPALEPAVGHLASILGLEVCYRDANVAKYGLENALMPVDTILLEVVAPITANTAAGRFLQRTSGRGGYMAIFACDDPDRRARHASALGVRTVNVLDHGPYHGVQLHPRDCRAAFIEFNHTEGSDNIAGAYPPAGPDWQKAIRTTITQALIGVELSSPDPAGLARHWSEIVESPLGRSARGDPEIVLPNATLRFVAGDDELMTGLVMKVRDVAAVVAAARSRGCLVGDDRFDLSGVTFRLQA